MLALLADPLDAVDAYQVGKVAGRRLRGKALQLLAVQRAIAGRVGPKQREIVGYFVVAGQVLQLVFVPGQGGHMGRRLDYRESLITLRAELADKPILVCSLL